MSVSVVKPSVLPFRAGTVSSADAQRAAPFSRPACATRIRCAAQPFEEHHDRRSSRRPSRAWLLLAPSARRYADPLALARDQRPVCRRPRHALPARLPAADHDVPGRDLRVGLGEHRAAHPLPPDRAPVGEAGGGPDGLRPRAAQRAALPHRRPGEPVLHAVPRTLDDRGRVALGEVGRGVDPARHRLRDRPDGLSSAVALDAGRDAAPSSALSRRHLGCDRARRQLRRRLYLAGLGGRTAALGRAARDRAGPRPRAAPVATRWPRRSRRARARHAARHHQARRP